MLNLVYKNQKVFKQREEKLSKVTLEKDFFASDLNINFPAGTTFEKGTSRKTAEKGEEFFCQGNGYEIWIPAEKFEKKVETA